MARHSVQEWY
jgi:hypothetical protein